MGITQGDGYYGQSNCGECHAFPIPQFLSVARIKGEECMGITQ